MVSRCLAAVLDWSLPEIFWTVFHGRRSRSALCGMPHKADYAGSPVMPALAAGDLTGRRGEGGGDGIILCLLPVVTITSGRAIIVVSAVPSYCQRGWWGNVRPGPQGDRGGTAGAVRGRVRGLAGRTGVHVRDRARLSALARVAERLARGPCTGWPCPDR